MYKVKLSINAPVEGVLRQSPGCSGVWGNYRFYINEDIDECDFWVVYSKGRKINESCRVAPENTIFITGEPVTIYHYDHKFLKQFDTVVSCRKDIEHKNIIYNQPAQPWHLGRIQNPDGSFDFVKSYDELESEPIAKNRLVSVISSNKAFTKGHQERINYVNKLKEYFGDRLSVFGRGFNEVEDKWDAIAPFKYHIVLENSAFDDYWTEKLADCYLSEAFPFYYGCHNIDKYFSKDSYQAIDIHDLDQSIGLIEGRLNKDNYSDTYRAIQKSKRLVLDNYNLFGMISSICAKKDPGLPKKDLKLRHDMSYVDLQKIPLLLSRLYCKVTYN